MKDSSWKAYLFVNAATLLWSGNVVLGRALRESIGPWTLAGLRCAIASVFFAALLARLRPSRPPATARDKAWVCLMALTGVVGFQGLLYTGLRHTTALNAGLVNATGPLITILLVRAFLGHRLVRSQMIGAVVSIAGVGVILTNGSFRNLLAFRLNFGDLVVLAAVALWGIYSIAGRAALARQPTVWVAGVSTLLATPILTLPAAVEWAAAPPQFDVKLLLALLYIGAGPSFLAFLAWNEGVRRAGPVGAMAFYNTLPLYAGIVGAVALGEWPGPAQLVGGTLIVTGCLIVALTGSPGGGSGVERGGNGNVAKG